MKVEEQVKSLTMPSYWDSDWKKIKKLTTVNTKTTVVEKQIANIMKKELGGKCNVTICQLGCGTGKWLKFLGENVKISEIWGIDFSPAAVQLSIQNIESVKNKEHKFAVNIVCGDILSPPFKPKSFDFIFSVGVLEHFVNCNEVIKLTSRYLKSGGKMLTIVPNINGLNGFFMKKFNPQSYQIHIALTPEGLKNAYKKAGFNNVKANYFGIMSLTSISWQRFCFDSKILNFIFTTFCLKLVNIFGRCILKLLGLRENKFFSPMIMVIGEY